MQYLMFNHILSRNEKQKLRRNNMNKAIKVTNQLDIEELNKLFEQGYTFESADDNGIYILKHDKLKAEPIRGKAIDNELSTNITLDTRRAQRSFDLLADTVKQIKDGERSARQPHVRIEFDDILDVPKVWVDGELIGDVDDKPLVSLKLNWNTDTSTENHKGFDVSYFDMTDGRGQSKGFHQGTLM